MPLGGINGYFYFYLHAKEFHILSRNEVWLEGEKSQGRQVPGDGRRKAALPGGQKQTSPRPTLPNPEFCLRLFLRIRQYFNSKVKGPDTGTDLDSNCKQVLETWK